MAKEWSDKTPDHSKLPEKASTKKKSIRTEDELTMDEHGDSFEVIDEVTYQKLAKGHKLLGGKTHGDIKRFLKSRHTKKALKIGTGLGAVAGGAFSGVTAHKEAKKAKGKSKPKSKKAHIKHVAKAALKGAAGGAALGAVGGLQVAQVVAQDRGQGLGKKMDARHKSTRKRIPGQWARHASKTHSPEQMEKFAKEAKRAGAHDVAKAFRKPPKSRYQSKHGGTAAAAKHWKDKAKAKLAKTISKNLPGKRAYKSGTIDVPKSKFRVRDIKDSIEDILSGALVEDVVHSILYCEGVEYED